MIITSENFWEKLESLLIKKSRKSRKDKKKSKKNTNFENTNFKTKGNSSPKNFGIRSCNLVRRIIAEILTLKLITMEFIPKDQKIIFITVINVTSTTLKRLPSSLVQISKETKGVVSMT